MLKGTHTYKLDRASTQREGERWNVRKRCRVMQDREIKQRREHRATESVLSAGATVPTKHTSKLPHRCKRGGVRMGRGVRGHRHTHAHTNTHVCMCCIHKREFHSFASLFTRASTYFLSKPAGPRQVGKRTKHVHTHTHARTHAHTHARTHTNPS